MNSKILTLLGFAAKAGKLAYGAAAATAAIKAGKSRLIVISGTVSDKSRKEITFHAGKNNVEVLMLDDIDMQTVSSAVGRSCGIISVNDSSFAASLTERRNMGGNANDK